MGHIVYDLAESLRAHLQDKMVTNLPAAYVSSLTFTDSESVSRVLAPGEIRVGRLQDDPTVLPGNTLIPSVYLGIHFSDPSDLGDGWKNTLAVSAESSATDAAYRLPEVREVGGSSNWWRRFVVEMTAFFIGTGQVQSEAARLASALMGCVERFSDAESSGNPDGWRCAMTDSFNETAMQSAVVKSHIWEGGGPPSDYIWRGNIWLQVLTGKN
jgi:hypothetical protein